MVDNKKLAEIFSLTENEVEMIKEAALIYQVDKDNEGYKDWCKMYEGVHREMQGETAVRNWLACIRFLNSTFDIQTIIGDAFFAGREYDRQYRSGGEITVPNKALYVNQEVKKLKLKMSSHIEKRKCGKGQNIA